MSFFHTHVHSEFSCLDAMTDVSTIVAKAAQMGHEGIGLTDHGNMSGVFQLYSEAKKAGIKPFLGLEAYVVDTIDDKKAKRHHLSLLAYTTQGYKNLARLSSLSHERDHYHYKPRLDRLDFIKASNHGATDGIACLTGCYFSEVCQAIVSEPDIDSGVAKAMGIVRFLQSIFPMVFIEVQHHKTQHDTWDDDRLVRALYQLSQESGCPPIITNDCHYCDKHDAELHDMMKSIAYSADPGDVTFPGDSYHLATTQWVKSHYRRDHMDVWEAAQDSYRILLDAHDVAIPTLDEYRYFVPPIASDPMAVLRGLCDQALLDLAPAVSTTYAERLDYELGVIDGLGFADYFLLVNDYVEWCRAEGIMVMARGSAAGSLVCFLLGFTQIDPLKWNLTFDRFLTPDRERPPDIDLDIEDVRRSDVVDYLAGKFDILQIGTYGRMGYDEETGRGSLFVQYMSAQRKIMGDKFPRVLGRVKDLHDLDRVRPDDARKLRSLADYPIRRSPGAHAAGFVVSAPPDHTIDEWLPTMLIPSSDAKVTQMMMDDVEDAGYIKVDLLGLRSLTTVRRCLEMIGQDGLEWIPLDDKDTFKFLRKGNADTGVFQMEGYTAAKGCREVKVKSVKDLILVNALYRPATRDAGHVDTFLANRADRKSLTYTHPIFKKHLEETHGVPCFQEQVLAILRDLGMPAAELNSFLKAVKGKHATGGYSEASTAVFDSNRQRFMDLCKQAGMTEQEGEDSWALVAAFAAYGFNRAHATAYGLFGYQMAYLKTHYPVQFHAALLETTVGSAKESKYEQETRRVGVPILGACVNRSEASWAIDPSGRAIRRGLVSIKGVGHSAACAIVDNGPYASVDQLIERCPARTVTGGKGWAKSGELTGVMAALKKAGALKQLGVGRS